MDSTAVSQSSPRRIVEVHRRRLGWDQSGSQTLAKGLTLLELVADRQGGYGVGLVELARELGWNKSTTHRLLATLVSLGYAQQDPESDGTGSGSRHFNWAPRIRAISICGARRRRALSTSGDRRRFPGRPRRSDKGSRIHRSCGKQSSCGCTRRSEHGFPGIVRQPARRSWRLFRRSRPSLRSRASFPAAPRPPSTSPRLCGHNSCESGPMATQRTMKRTLTVFAASPRRSSTRRVVRSPRSAFQAIPGKSQSSGFPSWGWLSGTLRIECHDGLAIKVCEIPSGGVRSWIDTVV